MRTHLMLSVVSSCICFALATPAVADAKLPMRNLRGYGLTQAEFQGENTVVVTAESPEKALLWAARYDHVYAAHRVRAGVYRLPGGGWTKLDVKKNVLTITYSQAEPSGELKAKLPEVPFYMNAWDDHPFRFYYREHATPPDKTGKYRWGTPWEIYDPLPEFDFAKANDGAGTIHWVNAHHCDTAKGMDDRNHWLWAKRLSESRGLPVVLNTNGGTPTWVLDEYREEQNRGAPDYLGGYHGVATADSMGEPFLSWAGDNGRELILDTLAKCLYENNTTNVIDFLEPHGELSHGDFTVYIEHGPLVDKSFRQYLKETYGENIATLAARWEKPSLQSWDDVYLPEIAEFAGFGPNALDLKGTWESRQVNNKTGTWGRVEMPGHALAAFMPQERTIFRRKFELPKNWKAGERTWLYVWDLAKKMGDRVAAKVNGKVYESFAAHGSNHWGYFEVTDSLKDGTNNIALNLPLGKCCYKVYLTHEDPKAYPYFGTGLNAQWVDFCGWQEWSRAKSVRRGLDRLREVEPDKGIVSMAPGTYFTTLREIAGEYGTRFHDTGGMAAFWWELLPMLMHSKGLPFSLEPGGPADDREGFRRMTNFYMSEGVNAIHYFIHLGCVFWEPEIREEFEKRLPALMMLGKICPPENEIAMVADSRVNMLMGYPWRKDVASAYPSGYMTWRFAATLGRNYQLDAITPCDFKDGNASNYKYLIDANNTLMDAEQVAGIEKYVRAGGTYIAMFQSGRHSMTDPDSWQLKKLAGVEPVWMSKYATEADENGIPRIVRKDNVKRVERAAASAYPGMHDKFDADGIGYKVTDPNSTVLWRWADGTAAVVSRPLGKGRIVSFGIRPHTVYESHEWLVMRQMLKDLGAQEKPIALKGGRDFGRHYFTTDGLYDVWYADTESSKPGKYEITFRDDKKREITDVITGKPMALSGTFQLNDFVMGTSLRGENNQAAWRWVKNQFGWWRGRKPEYVAPVETPEKHWWTKAWNWTKAKYHAWRSNDVEKPEKVEPKFITYPDVLPLLEGWHDEKGNAKKIEPYVVGLDAAPSNYVLTTTVTIPADWTDCDIELWGIGQYDFMFVGGSLAVRLDGKEVLARRGKRIGINGLALPMKAGETHTLELDVKDDSHMRLRGFGGPLYLYKRPHAKFTQDLAGTWEALATPDDANPKKVTLPGRFEKAVALKRSAVVPAAWKGLQVRIDYTSEGDRLLGVIVNGRFVRRHHHHFGTRTDINITPLVKFGEENEIILVGGNNDAQRGTMKSVVLKAVEVKK